MRIRLAASHASAPMIALRSRHTTLRIGLFTAAPSRVPAAGGQVKLTAVVAHASTCTFTFAASLGRSPAQKACGSGKVSTVVTLPRNRTASDRSFRFDLTASGGGSRTSAAPVTVIEVAAARPGAPQITLEPSNATVAVGATVSLAAAARGKPKPSVHWQVSEDRGRRWAPMPGATSDTLVFAAAPNQSGWEYRAVFSNSKGSVTTAPALLNVQSAASPAIIAVAILTNPASVSAASGTSAAFTASASGSPAPSVQWQLSVDGGATWSNITGAATTSYSIAAVTVNESGDQFRAVFTNVAGSVASAAATLTVSALNQAPQVTTQPINQGAVVNQSVTFSAAASGQPTPTVQWEESTDGGGSWTPVPDATSASYTFSPTTQAQSGAEFRAVFTNSLGSATTSAAMLTVSVSPTRPAIATQPSAQTVIAGQTATFTAAATGAPTPGVQWYDSTDGGGSWTQVPGATSPTYSFPAAASQSGDEFEAVFTNAAGAATSNAATLSVLSSGTPPQITQEPSNLAAAAGSTISFTAAASGVPTPSVQWEVSTDEGGTWGDISGATSATYSLSAQTAESGDQYRAVFSNGFGSPATSSAASLVVGGDAGSTNWSGYEADQSGTLYTMVTGSWIVPPARCPGPGAYYSSVWVGIDGANSSTVEQDGTESDCASGSPSYYAWSEFFPAATQVIGHTVLPGDSMTGSVSVSGSTWTLTLQDNSRGWTFTAVTNAPTPTPAESSAEWIVERPSLCSGGSGCLTSLADFGTATITGASATAGGITGSISAVNGSPLQMEGTQAQNPHLLALPSALGAGGSSFSDTWYGSS
ncbi:MAG TPA: G1 family glutamic endopeptidase [Solirubrobacteraceae bacterium]|nr:G1 family glutamic endopeptidase [Solirubrobacteraceae bacterium]